MAGEDGGWKFAQCFGDKGDVEEVTEGALDLQCSVQIVILVCMSSMHALIRLIAGFCGKRVTHVDALAD